MLPRRPPARPLPDVVRDSKLETESFGTSFKHVFHDTGHSVRGRLVRREETWVRERFLARGAYGTVYLERREGGPGLRAVKEIWKSVAGQEMDYTRELEAIFTFSHRKYAYSFVRSMGWFELEHSVFVAMEYLELGDLQQHLTERFPEEDSRQITSQVLEGLGFMHENGFVHRDLKPGNIMIVSKRPRWLVKIADFGLSKRRQEGVTGFHTSQQGTLSFAAPEAFGVSAAGSVSSYTFAVDMWSLGAVAYRMLAGTAAFNTILELVNYVTGTIDFPRGQLDARRLTEGALDFITWVMASGPGDRPSAGEAKEHPWMQAPCHPLSQGTASETDTWLSETSGSWSCGDSASLYGGDDRNRRPVPGQSLVNRDAESSGDQADVTSDLEQTPVNAGIVYSELRGGDGSSDEGSEEAWYFSSAFASPVAAAEPTLSAAHRFRRSIKDSRISAAHMQLAESDLDWESAVLVRYSTTQKVRRKGSLKTYLVDTMTCDSKPNVPSMQEDAEDLAVKLGHVAADMPGLLPCHGVVKRKDPGRRRLASIHLAFRMASATSSVDSLRSHLLHGPRPSLTEVMAVAGQLAGAVSLVHTCDFVHKNIRPETILLLGNDAGVPPSESSAYLLGFDSFRSVSFHTHRRGDAAPERDLYRHPSRHGLMAREKYVMQHDIYSLGVCLLELGLWESFVYYDEAEGQHRGTPEERVGRLGVDEGCPPGERAAVRLPAVGRGLGGYEEGRGMENVKDYLVALARSHLPARTGNKYAAVVVTCLTCLDPGNEDFGDEADMQDEDGVPIGVRFIEKVLLRLGQISV